MKRPLLPRLPRLLAIGQLLLTGLAQAQTPAPPTAPAPGPAAPAGRVPAATTPPADVILRLDGQEVPGRVLLITPTELRYLPLPAPGAPAAGRPDTLRLPVTEVFLVRYANGTREVLTRPAAEPTAGAAEPGLEPLAGLDPAQRRLRGQGDALRCYNGQGAFWGALGATLYAGPLLGLVAPAVIGSAPVKSPNLQAPQPLLLRDYDYATGYQQQANRRKRGRAWGGYGVATGAYVVLIVALLGSLN